MLWAIGHWRTVGAAIFALLIAGLVTAVEFERKEAELAVQAYNTEKERVANLRKSYEAQSVVLKSVVDEHERDDKLLTEINSRLDTMSQQTDATKAAIDDVSRANAQVKAYLDVAVPDDVKRLLRRQPATH